MSTPIPVGNPEAKLQSNVYEYNGGAILARDGEVNRENVDLATVPKVVQRTFVAAENKSFYDDAGVDLKGTTRASSTPSWARARRAARRSPSSTSRTTT